MGGVGVLWDPSFTDGCEKKTGSGGFMEEPEWPGHLCLSQSPHLRPHTLPQTHRDVTQRGRQDARKALREPQRDLILTATESLP